MLETLERVDMQSPRTLETDELGVIIPTYNAAHQWTEFETSLSTQGLDPRQIVIIDSSSSDGTRDLAEKSGYRVVCIPKEEFGHGRTRQAACAFLPNAKFLLFLTQDSILNSPHSVERLCDAMSDPEVGAAYGRQLPRDGANPIERHARLFNYPEQSSVRSLESRQTLGIKAAFLSNSFAVYRRAALEAVGGFPDDVIFGEDSYVAARMLMAGWKVVYQADATTTHSHAFTISEEFRRYFDIGVHHSREPWLLEVFGGAGGEGLRFVRSELKYLQCDRKLIPSALIRTAAKLLGYRLGLHWRSLPTELNRALSSNPGFWLT